ncbi:MULTISPECIES: DUF6089 family protein [Myroides]|uniref:DUF6089 domain-containing protein n=1 Tax=Myroides albus TaxID=2562892 RepID=A0A6I3LG83_9FLAO|nr:MULTISPECIES: DUF6089 family protein [Myroides]MTG96814.1 hypothetical protein [Myroides albus]MVX36919.1 hypothetical protein [Myroides sp. LoEW2-1]UVD78436.1 DUF6089 family protein [Myroides albus]
MNRLLISLLLLLTANIASAQIHEVGVGIGGANYVGDVGSTQIINPTDFSFHAYYRWNRSPRHSYRVSFLQTKISGNDAKSDMGNRKQRGYSFKNDIQQLSVGIEFNFFEFDLHEEKFALTPFLYLGVSGIRYDDLYYKAFEQPIEEDIRLDKVDLVRGKKKNSFAIPFGGGIKIRATPQLNITAEVLANYTNTDNLDGSHPKGDRREYYSFGKNGNDWFFYSGISISYTFGKNPCYCAD